jgi:SAM-dependent methyltransferase
MAFDVEADAYGRFMGRWSIPLAERFVGLIDPRSGQRALDVGCGPGIATRELVDRLGEDAVSAIDPSEPFVASARALFPTADVRQGSAERLPFETGAFDLALAQLVVHFMSDPVAGLREMARVTRPGGVVAACVWDHAGEHGPLADFWKAVRELDADAVTESLLPGTREGDLEALFDAAGLHNREASVLTITVAFDSFDDWWQPFTLGVGPAGDHVAGLDRWHRDELRALLAQRLPEGAFERAASAWTVVART